MKKVLAIVLAALICMLVCACSKGDAEKKNEQTVAEDAAKKSEITEEAQQEEENKTITSNENFIINNIFVDDSYVDEEGSPLKMVYLFGTYKATDANLKIDSRYCKMTIGESNSYESEIYPTVFNFTDKYCYTKYIEDVYTGESLDILFTFKIPEGDLVPGKNVTISDSQIPGVETFIFTTDIFEHKTGEEAIAEVIDPEAYAAYKAKYEPADEETKAKVKNEINGYVWSFYVYTMKYDLEFWAPNNFSVSVPSYGVNNSGTYEILNGFIDCSYPNGTGVKIPYDFNENGELTLDVSVFSGETSY